MQLVDQALPSIETLAVDLSTPDNTELIRGKPLWAEFHWYMLAAPVVSARWNVSPRFQCWLLRRFGARIGKRVHLKPGIRVKFPWYLTVGDYCWLGEDLWIDNLAPIEIASNVCISQGAYLCTGNHDWSHRNMRLFRRPICIKEGAWIGAKSIVCPGVTIFEGAILTAGSVAARDIPPFEIHTGNPATYVRRRTIRS